MFVLFLFLFLFSFSCLIFLNLAMLFVWKDEGFFSGLDRPVTSDTSNQTRLLVKLELSKRMIQFFPALLIYQFKCNTSVNPAWSRRLDCCYQGKPNKTNQPNPSVNTSRTATLMLYTHTHTHTNCWPASWNIEYFSRCWLRNTRRGHGMVYDFRRSWQRVYC